MKTRLIKSEIPARHTHSHRNRKNHKIESCCGLCAALRAVTRAARYLGAHPHATSQSSHMVMDMRPGTGFFHIPGSVPRSPVPAARKIYLNGETQQ